MTMFNFPLSLPLQAFTQLELACMRLVEAELAMHSAHSMHITQPGAQPGLPRSDPTLTGQAAAVAMPGAPAQAGADTPGGMEADRAAAGSSLPSAPVSASQALPLPAPGGSYQQFVASIRHSLADGGILQAFEAAQPNGTTLNGLLESLWLQRSTAAGGAAAQPPPSAAAAPAREAQHAQQGSEDDVDGAEWELLVERCSDATRHYVWLLLGECIFNKVLPGPCHLHICAAGSFACMHVLGSQFARLAASGRLYMAVDPDL